MTDAQIVEEGRQAYYQHGDRPGENPYITGRSHLREAQLWHRGFAEARAAKRQSQLIMQQRASAPHPRWAQLPH